MIPCQPGATARLVPVVLFPCARVDTYMLHMNHQPMNQPVFHGWSREFAFNERSFLNADDHGNRLSYTRVGSITEPVKYDADVERVGCMRSMQGFTSLTWDHENHLQSSTTQTVIEGSPDRTCPGEAEKMTKTRILKETPYLAPDLAIHRTYAGDGETVASERINAAVMADTVTTVAQVELTTDKANSATSTTTTPLIRYQIGRSLEIDNQANIIWYEEYSPYGNSTYIACRPEVKAPRRYRFAAAERDAETGLDYCGARYYAPWLGRWLSPDPDGVIDGLNLYRYCRNDPVNLVDPEGTYPLRDGDQNVGDDNSLSNADVNEEGEEEAHAQRIRVDERFSDEREGDHDLLNLADLDIDFDSNEDDLPGYEEQEPFYEVTAPENPAVRPPDGYQLRRNILEEDKRMGPSLYQGSNIYNRGDLDHPDPSFFVTFRQANRLPDEPEPRWEKFVTLVKKEWKAFKKFWNAGRSRHKKWLPLSTPQEFHYNRSFSRQQNEFLRLEIERHNARLLDGNKRHHMRR
ncbi:SpvB-domain-containing protein [Penicillium macrosclerotiorum]|uniref:SpvB-domain-containing protein n=1 Tax=Penicillium macrosclerotiorum TaxID=303699 RepID=UPI0025494A9B|nr:SpvB-domain-containing protein [Penicillium macrosclerotiorum]KAJ5666841.1 SpvB-domain-containing protein [Penicillium macrosclerotiorum]